jgi:tetratricopeptide (TPR) repeat protein
MYKQAAFGVVAVTLLLAAVCSAQRLSTQVQAAISGKVVTLDGHPAENARVELRDALTGTSRQSTYTNPAGQFEISDIEVGRYVLVASSGLDEARENVEVSQATARADVTLRLPRSFSDTSAGDIHSVSVQQMQVPSRARSSLKRAREALAKQRVEEAWKEVDKALSIYPTYAEALMLRGVLKLERNDAAGARADMEEAVKDDPGFHMGYIVLGAAYNRLSLFDDAVRVLDRGIAMSPTSWQGYYEMGKAYLAKGEFQTAVRQLEKAQQFAPDTYGPLHLVKAHALLGLQAYNDAVAELEAYLSKNPQGQDSDKARDTLQRVRSFMAKNGK